MATETEERVTRRPAFQPVHPGVILRDSVLPALNMTKTALADHLGLSRQTLYEIINEKRPVTTDVAARLARAFGNTTQFWLNLQTNHDAWAAERDKAVQQVQRIAVARLRKHLVDAFGGVAEGASGDPPRRRSKVLGRRRSVVS